MKRMIGKILYINLIFTTVVSHMTLAESNVERARKIHQTAILIDGHNDLPWALRQAKDMALTKYDFNVEQPKFHTDIPRLRKGGMGAQFWSAFVPSDEMLTGTAVKTTYEQIDLIHRFVSKYSSTFEFATSPDEIEAIYKKGKIASLIGVEGGHSIDNSLEILRELYKKGTRYMTLTHWKNLDWVEAATDKEMAVPLTAFGEKVVHEMNRLGMLVDISHISARAMRAVINVSKAPVIASHSSAYAITKHVRNVPDDVLKMIAERDGIVMVNFYPGFIAHENSWVPFVDLGALHGWDAPCQHGDVAEWRAMGRMPKATVSTLVDHIDHIVQTAGIDHVGLGSDFDGVDYMPEGLEDVSKYPAITAELLKRGYFEECIRKILGENLLRVFRKALAVSQP